MTEIRPDTFPGHALIVVPHSDDEILMFAGLIQRLLSQGQVPDVALVTNGDYEATAEAQGVTRPRETLQALALLGLSEEHIHLLGYADTGMPRVESFLWGLYQESDAAAVHPSHVGTHTYAPAEHPELHRVVYGEAGAYTRETLLGDLRLLLDRTKPGCVFTTHPLDAHGDHCALYWLLREVCGSTPVFPAFTHSAGGDGAWPLDGPNLTCPPDIGEKEWQGRFVLKLSAQEQRRKAQALELHKSALKPDATVFLHRFCKEDEVYFSPREDAQ